MIQVYRFCLVALCGLMLSAFVAVPQSQAATLQTSASFSCANIVGFGSWCLDALAGDGYNTDVAPGQSVSITVTRLTADGTAYASFKIRSGDNEFASFNMSENDGIPNTFSWTNNTGSTQNVTVSGFVYQFCFCGGSTSGEGFITVN
ncbi:MAG: hypothetical protein AAGF95_15710 [Chloroflexota bacterium]